MQKRRQQQRQWHIQTDQTLIPVGRFFAAVLVHGMFFSQAGTRHALIGRCGLNAVLPVSFPCRPGKAAVSARDKAALAGLYFANLVTSYLLMLAVMTYNVRGRGEGGQGRRQRGGARRNVCGRGGAVIEHGYRRWTSQAL